MSLQIPPLPQGDRPPSNQEIADLLSESLPESERAEGRALLLERILPSKLSGLAEHPKPRRLAEVVYEDLADELGEADELARLAVLRAAALRAEVEALAADSLSLAIARYLIDHPAAIYAAADWKTTAVERWMEKPLKELQDETTGRLARLDQLEEQIKSEHPDLWEPLRIAFVHAKLNLQSARSGFFETASGSLYGFLSALGETVDNFDIHWIRLLDPDTCADIWFRVYDANPSVKLRNTLRAIRSNVGFCGVWSIEGSYTDGQHFKAGTAFV